MSDLPQGAAGLEAVLAPHIRDNDWAGADEALAALEPRQLDPEAREAWYRYRGIVAFRRGDRAEAFARLLEARAVCPESAEIRFSLAQEHEYRGEPEPMFEHFDALLYPTLPAPHALAAARFAYLWEDPARGARYVAPLLDAWIESGPEEALLRGLPALGRVIAYAMAFAVELGEFASMEERLGALTARLEASEADEWRRFLDGWRTGDLTSFVASLPAGDEAPPLARLQRAVVGARAEEDVAAAAKLLAEVRVDDGPEPWLEDARLVATCGLLARRGESEPLDQLVEELLRRQPFLLDPDAALLSATLEDQAPLRARYRATRG
jgi:hypothetical protein